eukprot:Gb_33421 [translate_table: standard]
MKTTFEREKKELSSTFELEKEELHRSHHLEKAQLISKMENLDRTDETLKLQDELQQRLKEIAEGKMLQENLFQKVHKMDEELKLERLKQDLQASELERERNSKQDAIQQFKSLKKMYRGLRAQYDVILSLNGLSADKGSSAKKKLQTIGNDNRTNTSPDNLKQTSIFDYQVPESRDGRMVSKQEQEIHANGNPNGSDDSQKNSDLEKKLENVPSKESATRLYVAKKGLNVNCDNLASEPKIENVQSKESAVRSYVAKNDLDGACDNSILVKKVGNIESNESAARSYVAKKGVDGDCDSALGKIVVNIQSKESATRSSVLNPKCIPFEDEETEEQTKVLNKEVENHGLSVIDEEKKASVLVPAVQRTQLQKRPLDGKFEPSNLLRRKNSLWRETRLRQEPGMGVDPHDDFLDTPMEIVLQSLKQKLEVSADEPEQKFSKAEEKLFAQNEVQDRQFPQQTDVILDSDISDDNDETQATDPECAQKTLPARHADQTSNNVHCEVMKSENLKLVASNKSSLNSYDKPKEQNHRFMQDGDSGYKYIEPVRKKADREALKGVECKQCKKFYDAVLAEDAEGVSTIRCEHHDEVSRHRYRYVPPATPEGFWNIGFDSDL